MKLHRLGPALATMVALTTTLAATSAFAVPTTVAVEGVLTSTGGGPATDGDYSVAVGLYGAEIGGQASWSEGPLTVTVKGGLFSLTLGTKKALDAATLADAANTWFGIAIGSDPELPRKPLHAVPFAVRAGMASNLQCSGCITAGHLDAQALAGYAKTADLAKVATSGAFGDLSGAPNLAKVATSGAYGDLAGKPTYADVATTGAYADLSGSPSFAKVATSGAYGDLKDLPVLAKLGTACGTGLVIKGLKADGSYECVVAMDPSALPADGIDEISNGLIANQFVDKIAGKTGVKIPDNNPVGVSDAIDFPDIGVAQKLVVSVDLNNSKINTLSISVFDPDGKEYVLHQKSGSGTALKTSYPAPTKTVSGDLTTWIGKNPKGKWFLKVVDTDYLNNTTDGQVNAWSIDLQTLSSKKIQVNGDLYVNGNLYVQGTGMQLPLADSAPVTCDASKFGYTYASAADKTIYYCNGKTWFGMPIEIPPKSCKEILANDATSKDGVYTVDPDGPFGNAPLQVLCNMTRDGGGWTLGIKHWYQSGLTGNTGSAGTISDAQQHNGVPYKLTDQAITQIIGDATYDVMFDQIGYNSYYSNGNYEYVVIRNYTAPWTWAGRVAASSTATNMESFRVSDNASAWKGNLACGNWGGWGINCFDVASGNNPAGGAGCGINMGKITNGGWHNIYMAETNTDTYLYMCNGAQHSSSYNMTHRFWFR
ncbi:MAG: fibrinogen-like YCDxxxxGGGW domain-containing protein [Myxococcota bacterium]